MANALFPAFVQMHSVPVEDRHGLDPQRFGVAIPSELANAVPKRLSQFVAGRMCAMHALSKLSPALATTAIGIGPHREPLWPVGVVGAITHTETHASAAVAYTADARGLGLDIEPLIAEETLPEVDGHIASDGELAALAPWDRRWLLTTVFSAKECLYKCLFPLVRSYFDFRDAAVTAIDETQGTVRLRLLVTLTPALPAGATFEARFSRAVDSVTTALLLPP
jgi:4'-phosphopantetheinyl transferase EntD